MNWSKDMIFASFCLKWTENRKWVNRWSHGIILLAATPSLIGLLCTAIGKRLDRWGWLAHRVGWTRVRKSTKNVDSLVKFVVRGGWRELLLPLAGSYLQQGLCGTPARSSLDHVSGNKRQNGHDSAGRHWSWHTWPTTPIGCTIMSWR